MGQLVGGAKTGELQEKPPDKIALPSKMTIMLKIFLSKTFYSKEHSPMAISMKDVELRHLVVNEIMIFKIIDTDQLHSS